MNLDPATTSELADLLIRHFRGRQDAYAIRSRKPNRKGKSPYHTARTPDQRDLPLFGFERVDFDLFGQGSGLLGQADFAGGGAAGR